MKDRRATGIALMFAVLLVGGLGLSKIVDHRTAQPPARGYRTDVARYGFAPRLQPTGDRHAQADGRRAGLAINPRGLVGHPRAGQGPSWVGPAGSSGVGCLPPRENQPQSLDFGP